MARTVSRRENRRRVRRADAVLLLTGTAYSVGGVLLPAIRLTATAPGLRAVIEVAGLSLVLVSVLVLAIPDDEDVRPVRNAFVAALAVLAVTNVLFGVAASFGWQPLVSGGGLAYYPWLASRYVAGGLFLLAALERPRASLPVSIGVALALLLIVDIVLLGAREALPTLVELRGTGAASVIVRRPVLLALSQAVPAMLFALGAWSSGRAYVRTNAPIFLLMSPALLAQVFTHVHEALHPAFLGPVVTSADLFRGVCFGLLAAGAILQVRHLYLGRFRTVVQQEADLRAQDVMSREITRMVEQEQDFRAIVSHELATPIATIGAFTHVLTARLEPPAGPVERALVGIRSEVQRLSSLVARMDELRDLEREDFVLDPRPVRLRPFLEEAALFVRGLPGSHPIVLRCPDVRVSADPVRLGQAVRNVLSNSARYAPPATPIVIEAAVTSDTSVIRISDEGPGVPREERASILRRYARGTRTRTKPGAGLGLYVASTIVAAHGGSLHVEEPTRGTGTRVVIELPTTRTVPAIG